MRMRTIAALFVCCCVASPASAATLIYEPFDYSAGQAIAGQGGWNEAGAATSPVHSVVSPGLTSPPGFLAASGNAADMVNTDTSQFNRIDLPNAFNPDLSPKYGANSTLYYSLLFNVPDIAGLNTPNSNVNANNDMIIAFNNTQGATASRPSNWGGELVIRLGSTADTYNLGIRASSTPGGTTYWSSDISPGDTHLIVVRYLQGADAGGNSSDDSNDLWIDPRCFKLRGSRGQRAISGWQFDRQHQSGLSDEQLRRFSDHRSGHFKRRHHPKPRPHISRRNPGRHHLGGCDQLDST